MIILCTVDITTREVAIPSDQRIASYDHNADVIRFQVETIPGFSLDTSSIKIAAQGPNKARHDYAVDPSTVSIEEETGYITFDWPIPQGVTEMPIGTFKYGDTGQLIFAVCAEIIDGSTVSKAWHSDDGIITVVAHLEPESGGGEDPEEEATNAQKIAQLQTDVAVINTQVGALANGSPTPVATIAEMTDESTVYIYTGSESGESTGYWYSYDSTQAKFVPRGEYGAGVIIDSTFTIPGAAPDSAETGEAIGGLDDRLTNVESSLSGDITMSLTWERGNINSSGKNSNNLRTIRTPLPMIPVDVDTLTLTFDGSYSTDPIVSVYCYQSDGTYISAINKVASATVTLPAGTAFVRFKLSTGSSDSTTVIDPTEGNDFLQVTYFTSIDVVQLANDVEGKLNTNAGATNAGKILSVGGDGMIVPVDSARTEKTIYMEWERGSISSSGNNSSSSSTKYIRNKYRYKVIKATNNLHVPTGMTIRVFVYNTIAETSDAFVEYLGAYTADTEITLTVGTYIRLVALYTDNSDIAVSDGDSVALSYGITEQETYDSYSGMVLSGYSALSMFETIGIIGDSWASGSIHTPNGYVDTNYQMSWGKILGRKIGATVTNFSKGGLSSKTWLEDTTYGLSALLADTAKQCYIINLGINDNTQIKAGTLTLGTIEDVNTEDYTQNPDTFFGDYGRIIGNIKEHAPKAVIFLMSVARPNERNMDAYIAQIAEEYGLPYINLPDDNYFESGYFFGSIYDGHMSAYGYSGIAQAIERLLQRYIIVNRSQFAYYDGLTV